MKFEKNKFLDSIKTKNYLSLGRKYTIFVLISQNYMKIYNL